MLEVENLRISYGYIRALDGVSLHVEEGEIVTLIGGNGAGKTSTLMSISNLVEKAGGFIRFKGKDISAVSPDKIVRMGISHVPEGRKIFPALNVYENLVAGSLGNPKLKKEDVRKNLETIYGMFPRLGERRRQSGGSLSGGEQQMLAIARGLMMNPELILLDEPSLGLAPIMVEEIFELIMGIRKTGKTILLIEQNAVMALSAADRAYVLENGKVYLEGQGKDLLNNPAVRSAYLGG
ncbi:MAG: ABC transporter ATP-binding protein [Treponema sp.]|nr:ABC transporter ATP-binding protein [Treponema sp.]